MSNENIEGGFSYYPFTNNKNGKTYYKKYKLKGTRKGRPKMQKTLLKEKFNISIEKLEEEKRIVLNNILNDENDCCEFLDDLIKKRENQAKQGLI